MANELSYRADTTGSTIYATIRSAARTMWNGSALESLQVAHWENYAVAMPESNGATATAGTYFYCGTFPAGLTAGWYAVDIFLQTGGTAAISDMLMETQYGYWDGTTFVLGANDTRQLNGIVADGSGATRPSLFLKKLSLVTDEGGDFALEIQNTGSPVGDGDVLAAYIHGTTVGIAISGNDNVGISITGGLYGLSLQGATGDLYCATNDLVPAFFSAEQVKQLCKALGLTGETAETEPTGELQAIAAAIGTPTDGETIASLVAATAEIVVENLDAPVSESGVSAADIRAAVEASSNVYAFATAISIVEDDS